MLTKVYSNSVPEGRERYSLRGLLAIVKKRIFGNPVTDLISTSYIERQNRTVRMAIRRFTRLVDAFSKKFENLNAACAPCTSHTTMEAGITDHIWGMRA